MMTYVFALLTASAVADSSVERLLPYAKEEGVFVRIPVAGPPENAVFALGVGVNVVTLSSGGEMWLYKHDQAGVRMKFPASWEGYPEKGWYFLAPEGLYLVLEMTDVETGWTELYLMNPETFEVLERREFPAFNFGPSLLKGDSLYVAGIGFLASLDRKTLAYRWCHWNLYGLYRANSFERLSVQGEVFLANYRDHPEQEARTLTLNVDTGEILGHQPIGATDGRGACPSPISETSGSG